MKTNKHISTVSPKLEFALSPKVNQYLCALHSFPLKKSQYSVIYKICLNINKLRSHLQHMLQNH